MSNLLDKVDPKEDIKIQLTYDVIMGTTETWGLKNEEKYVGVFNVYVEGFKDSLPYWNELIRYVKDDVVNTVEVKGRSYPNVRVWFFDTKDEEVLLYKVHDIDEENYQTHVIGGFGFVDGKIIEYDKPFKNRK